MGSDDRPILSVASRAAWDAWLAEHHESSGGVRLKLAKKGAAGVSHAEALEVALCYGWIDGQANSLDDTHWLVRFTPRRRGSRWSKRNRDKVEALIERGEMKPAGLREIERAKADGRWEAAYDGQRTATVPDDLRRALDGDEQARAFFETLSRGERFTILYRLQEAKRPETRARRIAQYVAKLRAHQKP
jgi:uncharacterized protein YdeI (YjbR/CyaY-like superfamily)